MGTAYMGCIGDDDFGKKLQEACKTDGVQAMYLLDKSTPTGKCAVAILDNAKIIYSAGFFITVSPESMDIASDKTVEKGTVYCLNLSAPFIVQVPPFRAQIDKLLPAVDYLFGNEDEARAYAEAAGWESTDVEFIATRLSLVPMKGGKPPRKVVITQGCDPTVVAIRGNVTKYPVVALPQEELVDTNGAGDAFVGGFLAALVKGKDVKGCCDAGAYSASVIIQHSGCTYPAKPEYSF